MKLRSLARRNGEPAALLYGVHPDGERVYAGLLLVQAGLTRCRLTFEDPTTHEKFVLILPKDALKRPKPANAARQWLEVVR